MGAEENVEETQFRGVTKRTITGCYKPYIASIFHKAKWRKIGVFKTARDAARAYDVEALRLLGPKSELNFTYNHETQRMYEKLKQRKLLRKSRHNISLPKLDDQTTAVKRKRRKSKRIATSDDLKDDAVSLKNKRQTAIEQSECVPNICSYCGTRLTSSKIQCRSCKRGSCCSTSCFVNNFKNHTCWAPPNTLI